MTDVAQALGFMWESSHRTNRVKLNTSDSLGPAINILSEHFSKGLRAQEYRKYNGNLSIYVNVTLYVSKSNMIFDIWGTSIFHCIYNNTLYLVGIQELFAWLNQIHFSNSLINHDQWIYLFWSLHRRQNDPELGSILLTSK